jgi:hypothetical protein
LPHGKRLAHQLPGGNIQFERGVFEFSQLLHVSSWLLLRGGFRHTNELPRRDV